jgi:hypothetical protein
MAPPGQNSRASRTRQPARSEPFLDRDRVGLYREHRASARNHTALPHGFRPRTQREGCGLPRPEDRHGDCADQPGQRDSPNPSVIGTLNGARAALNRHPGRRQHAPDEGRSRRHGTVIDDSLGDEVRVTLIAAGLT